MRTGRFSGYVGIAEKGVEIIFLVVLRTLVQPFHSLKHRFSGFLFLFLFFVPSTSIPSLRYAVPVKVSY